jgi:hypothetical protein
MPDETQHTPGPWEVDGDRDGDQLLVIQSESKGEICNVTFTLGYGHADEANARLIAAAPDLLAACEAALARENQRDTPAFSSLRGQLRNAIAKAKEQPQCREELRELSLAQATRIPNAV